MRRDELLQRKVPKHSKERLAQNRGLNLSSFQCLCILLHFLLCLQEEPKLNGITVKCNYIRVLLIWAQNFKTAPRFVRNQLQTHHTPSDSSRNLVTSVSLDGIEIRKLVCACKSNGFEIFFCALQ